jgi:hypothetical protein
MSVQIDAIPLTEFSHAKEKVQISTASPAVKMNTFTSVRPKKVGVSTPVYEHVSPEDAVVALHGVKKDLVGEEGVTGEADAAMGGTKPAAHKMSRQELLADRAYLFYRKVMTKGKELILYVIFMLVFTLATYYLRGDERVFYMSNRVKANLLERDFGLDMGGEKTFFDVSDVRDVWLFINNPMTEFLYGLQLDVNKTNYGQDSLFYVNQHNRYAM